IERCVFRGYSPGFYRVPSHPASHQHMGIFNEGIQVPNGKRVIIREYAAERGLRRPADVGISQSDRLEPGA
ncbi:MAG: hypothetical protein RBS80_30465, partial [Thermoguttaceae bacterium]|nr:hypothetical protein [Thermoguttaceae bacterium]